MESDDEVHDSGRPQVIAMFLRSCGQIEARPEERSGWWESSSFISEQASKRFARKLTGAAKGACELELWGTLKVCAWLVVGEKAPEFPCSGY